MPTEKKEYSIDDIERIKEQAVLNAEVGELKSTVPEIFVALKGLTKAIAEIPIKIMECRDDMDREIKEYMHDRFLTERDLEIFERKVEVKIDIVSKQVSKGTWVISGFISMGVFVMWLMEYTDLFNHLH